MRREDDVGERPQIGARVRRHVRLAHEYIQCGSSQTTSSQRIEQRTLVDDRAARSVDQPRAGPKQRQPFLIHEADVALIRRYVKAYEVCLPHGFSKIIRDGTKMFERSCRSTRLRKTDDPHAVAERSNARDSASDCPAADDG